MKYNSKKLQQVALKNENGFTVDKETLEPIKDGFSVAVKETQNSFGYKGLIKAFFVGINTPIVTAFGGWYNKDNRKFYFDAVVVFKQFNKALQFAKDNEQIALFDLKKGKEIKLTDTKLISSYL